MAGFLLHVGAVVMCAHGGQAQPTVPNPRVMVMGMPTVTVAGPWVVAGCPLASIPSPPCLTGQWSVGTVRVTSLGQPLRVAITAPGPGALLPASMQTRVQAM
jgi:hypothetical protein